MQKWKKVRQIADGVFLEVKEQALGCYEKGVAIAAGVTVSAQSFAATGPDLSSLSGSVDFTTITVALLAIGAAAFAPRVIVKAIRYAKSALSAG